MNFSLREWLIFVGIIVILGVMLDGYRRIRSGNRGKLKMAIGKNQKNSESDRVDYFNGELPNGGARVVTHTDPADDAAQNDINVSFHDTPPIPAFDVDPELRPDPLFAINKKSKPETTNYEDQRAVGDSADEPWMPEPDSPPEPVTAPVTQPVQNSEIQVAESVSLSHAQPEHHKVDEVIVMNVFAKDDKGFNGAELMRVIMACGMRYGDMNIFHRSEENDGGTVQFSMANAVKPGTFDLNNMDNFYTSGVSFFLSLPGPKNSLKAFDYMHETAQCVVKNLNGEMRDEIHSTMTSQTIEHSRQKIRDYERRQLSLLR